VLISLVVVYISNTHPSITHYSYLGHYFTCKKQVT